MKKFLLLSHYAPKPGFAYPEHDCPLAHRDSAHESLYAFERYWPEGVLWQTLEVENVSEADLLETVKDQTWDAIWLSGSPYLLSEADAVPWINSALKSAHYLIHQNAVPVVGLCFGLQLMAQSAGANICRTNAYKAGETDILTPTGQKLVRTRVYHENYVTNLPEDVYVVGKTECGMPYLVEFSQSVVGVQSHPEHFLNNPQDQQEADKFWRDYFQSVVC